LAQNNPQNYPLPALGSESAFLSGLLKNLIAEYEAEATSSHINAASDQAALSAKQEAKIKEETTQLKTKAAKQMPKATVLTKAGQTRALDDLDLHQTTAATKIQAGLIITDFLNSSGQERKNLTTSEKEKLSAAIANVRSSDTPDSAISSRNAKTLSGDRKRSAERCSIS
jgi:3-oxoacyl-(acyl-carrier-protein) synthase